MSTTQEVHNGPITTAIYSFTSERKGNAYNIRGPQWPYNYSNIALHQRERGMSTTQEVHNGPITTEIYSFTSERKGNAYNTRGPQRPYNYSNI